MPELGRAGRQIQARTQLRADNGVEIAGRAWSGRALGRNPWLCLEDRGGDVVGSAPSPRCSKSNPKAIITMDMVNLLDGKRILMITAHGT